MGLYLGDSRIKISSDAVPQNIFIFFSNDPISNGVALKSSDRYSLQDRNELYLRAKGEKK